MLAVIYSYREDDSAYEEVEEADALRLVLCDGELCGVKI
jgi:hypothetical protein